MPLVVTSMSRSFISAGGEEEPSQILLVSQPADHSTFPSELPSLHHGAGKALLALLPPELLPPRLLLTPPSPLAAGT